MKKNNFWLLIILILPFMEPLGFKDIEVLDSIYSALKVMSFLIICILYTIHLKKNKYKMSKFVIIVILYFVELYFSTLINNGYYNEFFGQTISVLGTVLLTQMYVNNKETKTILKVLCTILFIYSVINIFTIFMMKNNSDLKVAFLGMDNRYIFLLLPLCVFSILYSILKNNKLNVFSYIVIIMSILQVFYEWSVGAMLAISILLIYTLIVDKNKKIQKITLRTYLIIIIILNILLVFMQIQYYFEDFIVGYLHKSIELSGRVYTWNHAIEIIKENPLLGIGGKTAEVMQTMYYKEDPHAHNLFLNILVKGGILSLVIQIWMYIEIDKNLNKYNNKKISGVLAFSIFLILFLSLADTFDIYLVYIIYTLAYNINKLEVTDNLEKNS